MSQLQNQFGIRISVILDKEVLLTTQLHLNHKTQRRCLGYLDRNRVIATEGLQSYYIVRSKPQFELNNNEKKIVKEDFIYYIKN